MHQNDDQEMFLRDKPYWLDKAKTPFTLNWVWITNSYIYPMFYDKYMDEKFDLWIGFYCISPSWYLDWKTKQEEQTCIEENEYMLKIRKSIFIL
jgi:hypothetical protein